MSAKAKGAVPTLVTYRPKPGKQDALLALVKKHWPALARLGLVTDKPATIWRAENKHSDVSFVEYFEWKTPESPDVAHQTPEVMAIWEPMGELLAGMEIASLEAV